jgi:hypothetical protein
MGSSGTPKGKQMLGLRINIGVYNDFDFLHWKVERASLCIEEVFRDECRCTVRICDAIIQCSMRGIGHWVYASREPEAGVEVLK